MSSLCHTYRFSRGRAARTSIVPVNWLFCKCLDKDTIIVGDRNPKKKWNKSSLFLTMSWCLRGIQMTEADHQSIGCMRDPWCQITRLSVKKKHFCFHDLEIDLSVIDNEMMICDEKIHKNTHKTRKEEEATEISKISRLPNEFTYHFLENCYVKTKIRSQKKKI